MTYFLPCRNWVCIQIFFFYLSMNIIIFLTLQDKYLYQSTGCPSGWWICFWLWCVILWWLGLFPFFLLCSWSKHCCWHRRRIRSFGYIYVYWWCCCCCEKILWVERQRWVLILSNETLFKLWYGEYRMSSQQDISASNAVLWNLSDVLLLPCIMIMFMKRTIL